MTRDEAIERIRKIKAYMESLDADEEEQLDLDALRFALTDMKLVSIHSRNMDERLVEKKVKWSEIEFPYAPGRQTANCPNCKRKLRCLHTKENYCPKCGQALDWSKG